MRRAWLLLVLPCLLAGGCADPKIVPLLGNWTGAFRVESVDDKAPEQSADFKAYLQLYRTHDKFKLRIENRLQASEITGVWRRKASQIELVPSDFKFENPSEEDQRTKGMRIVQPDEMRKAFGKTFYLDLASDEQHLTGAAMTLGNLAGRYQLVKGAATELATKEYDRMRKGR
jgi:hypothetical protein